MMPQFFEVRFGPGSRKSTDEADATLSTDEPFVLNLGEGDSGPEIIRITGQIDRIDIGQFAGSTVFNIIDYKSGKPVKIQGAEVTAGQKLQLPLYALATEEMLLADREAVAWQTGYWNVKEGGFSMGTGRSSGSVMQIHQADEGQIRSDTREQTAVPGSSSTACGRSSPAFARGGSRCRTTIPTVPAIAP